MAFGKFLSAAVEKFTGASPEKKGPDRREPGEIMSKADIIGYELSAMIISEFPEDREMEEERQASEEALRGKIVDSKPMGRGITGSLRVKFEDGGEGVSKPRAREQAIQEGVRPGTFAMREWLAAQIDRAAGFGLVPATILRDGPEGMGSVQEIVKGRAPIDDLKLMGTWEKIAKPVDLMRMRALDRLMKQADRKGDNFLIEEDGGLDAIDNSLIYSTSKYVNIMSSGVNLIKLAHERRKGEVAPAEREKTLKRLGRLRGSKDVLDKLHEAFVLAMDAQDGEAAWKEFRKALDEIVDKKDI